MLKHHTKDGRSYKLIHDIVLQISIPPTPPLGRGHNRVEDLGLTELSLCHNLKFSYL